MMISFETINQTVYPEIRWLVNTIPHPGGGEWSQVAAPERRSTSRHPSATRLAPYLPTPHQGHTPLSKSLQIALD